MSLFYSIFAPSLLFSFLLFSVRKEKWENHHLLFLFSITLCLRVHACLHNYFCVWSLPLSFIMCIISIIHFWIYVWMRSLAGCFLSQLMSLSDPKLCQRMFKALTPTQIKADLHSHMHANICTQTVEFKKSFSSLFKILSAVRNIRSVWQATLLCIHTQHTQ